MSNSYNKAVRACSILLIGMVFGCTSSSANGEGKPLRSDSVDDFPEVMLLVHKAAEGELAMLSLALDTCEVDLAHVSSKTDAPDAGDVMVVDTPPSSTTPVDRKTYTCNKADLEKGRLLFSKDRVEALRNLHGDFRFSIIWPNMNQLDSFSVPRESDNPAVKEVVEYLLSLDARWSAH